MTIVWTVAGLVAMGYLTLGWGLMRAAGRTSEWERQQGLDQPNPRGDLR
jgi:hypothetical protein